MNLTEVYRIIYDGPEKDVLQGVIFVDDYENGPQLLLNDREIEEKGYGFLFEDELDLEEGNIREMVRCYVLYHEEASMKLSTTNKPIIEPGDHILLKGPTEASIGDAFDISLYLFSACDAFKEFTIPSLKPVLPPTPLRAVIMGDSGSRQFTVLYAMFGNAGEARVKVKLTKMNSAFHVYGIVTARTSAIHEPNYSSIIFFRDEDCDELTMGPGDEMILPLCRPLVAVPHGSKLILEFNLFSDDNDTLVQDIVSFEANRAVINSETVTRIGNKCVIEVGVSWRWIQKLDDEPIEN